MSGGSFDYAYRKLQDSRSFEDVNAALRVIEVLMQDVEWVESCDSSWDTEMAAKWYQLVYNLCAKVSGK